MSITLTGPWFVMIPARPGEMGGRAMQFNAEDEAGVLAEAQRRVREEGETIYIARAMYKLELPVHMTAAYEEKPDTPADSGPGLTDEDGGQG